MTKGRIASTVTSRDEPPGAGASRKKRRFLAALAAAVSAFGLMAVAVHGTAGAAPDAAGANTSALPTKTGDPVQANGARSLHNEATMAQTPSTTQPENASPAIRPFQFHASDEALADLRRRIAATKWPSRETVADDSQGVQLATMRELARYWQTDYDWRKVEARLNALPQFVTKIDGLDIHFIHVRSKHPNALPMIVTHGWPGSIIEQLKIIEPLTNPTAHGGSASDAFDIVIPSLPGHGFSAKADRARLGSCSHRARLDRPDEAPRLHAIRGAGRRLGECGHRADGLAGASGTARHSHQHARHRPGRHRQGAPGRRRRRPASRPTSVTRTSSSTFSTGTAWRTPRR